MTTSATAADEPPTLAETRPVAAKRAVSAPPEPALSSATRRARRMEWLLIGLLLALSFAIVFEFGLLYVSLLSQAP